MFQEVLWRIVSYFCRSFNRRYFDSTEDIFRPICTVSKKWKRNWTILKLIFSSFGHRIHFSPLSLRWNIFWWHTVHFWKFSVQKHIMLSFSNNFRCWCFFCDIFKFWIAFQFFSKLLKHEFWARNISLQNYW